MNISISNNRRQYRFELTQDNGEPAYLEYRWLKGNMLIMKTYVPPSARLSGFGSALVQHAFGHAAAQNIRIKCYCPFAAKYVSKHPALQTLLAE